MDLRVSILPVVYGEKVVIRILDKNNYKVHKEHLGLSTENINKLIDTSNKSQVTF